MSWPQEITVPGDSSTSDELHHHRRCPLCCERIHPEARRCSHCKSWLNGSPWQAEWYRGGPGTRLAGVCAGLANQFGISATLLRVFFVLATFLGGGLGPVLYAVLWFIMPHVSRRVDRGIK